MLLFVLGVSVAAVRGGLEAGIAATLLSIPVGFYLFVEPRYALLPTRVEDWARLVVFLVEGVIISVAAGRVVREKARLEEIVGTRTSELRESNEALEGFAHTISHDMRAPLRSMRGFAEILEQEYADRLPPEAREFTGRIVAAALRLDELVNNLLAYTRLGHGTMTPEPVALKAVIDDALAQLAPEIASSHARVVVEYNALGTVKGHRDTIAMMIANLISNAIKYVPRDRQPEVTLGCRRVDGHLRLTVRDNGIGIAAADRDRIFMAFERLHARDGYPGTGLGLAIVARGAERMHGRYGVDSDGSRGSEFWIELPAARTEARHVSPDPAR